MSFHIIVRFEPKPGEEAAFRKEILRVTAVTRKESDCLAMHVFESIRQPVRFAIHSEWTDEEAFERHSVMAHTVRFLEAAKDLLTHPVEGLRLREMASSE